MSSFFPFEARFKKRGLKYIAGIDEAGRGPLAGPLVSAAVILKENAKLPGLRDSKAIPKAVREQLFKLIIKNCIDYSISIISHLTVDKINILETTKYANYLCVKHLRPTPDIALIDGHDSQILDIPFQTIVKGDQKVRSIAAASILAKVTRDKIMERYSQEYKKYGFEKHMGYGTRLHRSNIKKHGYCEIHRKTYKIRELCKSR
jgi:ribonuclease HII